MDSYSTEKMNEYIEKFSDYEGKIIYHYTSPDALLSILDKEMIVLRFTRADCLNDKTEGKDLEKYYKQACEELRRQCAVSDDVYQFISSIGFEDTYTFFSQDGKTVRNEPTDIYICCLSRGKDSLAMWNYYSKENRYEGYNLGFQFNNSTDLSHCFQSLRNDAVIDLFKIVYDDSEKKKLLLDLLKSLYDQCDFNKDDERRKFKEEILKHANNLRYLFKHEAFIHENEIRFILRIPHSRTGYDIKFRQKNGIIIPYIDLKMEKRFLKRITIGPLIEASKAKNTLGFLLKQRGYEIAKDENDKNGVYICESTIPIRY